MIATKRPNTILLILAVISGSFTWLFAYGGNQQTSSLSSDACSSNNTYPKLALIFGIIGLLLSAIGITIAIKNKQQSKAIFWIILTLLMGISGGGAFFISSFCLSG
jgi:heme/copper-type cytochrome/quinol oxidase subunit 3